MSKSSEGSPNGTRQKDYAMEERICGRDDDHLADLASSRPAFSQDMLSRTDILA